MLSSLEQVPSSSHAHAPDSNIPAFRSFTVSEGNESFNALERAVLAGHIRIVKRLQGEGWYASTLLRQQALKGILHLNRVSDEGNFEVAEALMEVLKKTSNQTLASENIEDAKLNAFIKGASAGCLSFVRKCQHYALDPLKLNDKGHCAYMRAIRHG